MRKLELRDPIIERGQDVRAMKVRVREGRRLRRLPLDRDDGTRMPCEAVKQRLGRGSPHHRIRHRVGVPLERIVGPAIDTAGHAVALLNHVSELVCRGVQIRYLRKRDRLTPSERSCTQCMSVVRRLATNPGVDVRDAVPSETALDPSRVRNAARDLRLGSGGLLLGWVEARSSL